MKSPVGGGVQEEQSPLSLELPPSPEDSEAGLDGPAAKG